MDQMRPRADANYSSAQLDPEGLLSPCTSTLLSRLALLLLALPAPALAGFAAQGATPPAAEGDVSEPVFVWDGQSASKGAWSVDGLFDIADAPLLRWEPVVGEPGARLAVPLLDDVVSLRLGARYAFTDRVSIAATFPIVLSHKTLSANGSSPNLGDAELAVPITALSATGGNTAGRVAIVPGVRMPTGANQQYLGDDGWGVQVLAVGAGSVGRFNGALNVGMEVRSFEGESNVQPGPGLVGGAALGARLSEGFGVHLEGRLHQRLPGEDLFDPPEGYVRAAGGSEVLLTARGKLPGGTWITGGFGAAPNPGFGAARGRVVLGVGHRFGKSSPVAQSDSNPEPQKDPTPTVDTASLPLPVVVMIQDEAGVALDGKVSVQGGTSVRAIGGRAELDLLPGSWSIEASSTGFGGQSRDLDLREEQRSGETITFILHPERGDGIVSVTLTSPEGDQVANARVSVDGRPIGTTASGGGVVVRGLSDQPVTIEAQAESFRDESLGSVRPSLEETPVDMLLIRERGAVKVSVFSKEGSPISGVRTRFSGPDRLGPYNLGELGERTFVLRPGTWQVLVSHPDYGVQQRTVVLPDEDTELTRVGLVLQPPESGEADLAVRVVDVDNRTVPEATVQLDGASYGTTSRGGQLLIEDLADGPRTLSISGAQIQPKTVDIRLHPGLQEQLIVADWKPGSTMIRARGPRGMAPDATARFDGPQPQPRLNLGADGVEFMRLNVGIWQVLVSSPTLGMAQRGVQVPGGTPSLTIVDVLLGDAEQRGNTLVVEVVDPEGEPVQGAAVSVDQSGVGTTASLGTLAIANVPEGRRRVDVSASPYSPEQQTVSLAGKEQTERISLDWGVGAVRVRTQAAGEAVTDAVVRIGGPRFVAPTPVDSEGQRLFDLESGTWEVLVSSPKLGLQQARLQVPDRPQLTELTVELGPAPQGVAQTIIRVQAPDGSPIPEAKVRVDELAPVDASGGYAALTGITPGAHRIEITAPDFEPVVVDEVDLEEGTNERIIPMPWVPRPLDIVVHGPDGPVDARLVLEGPEAVPMTQTGGDGSTKLELAPGAWEIMAFAEGLGAQRTSVILSEKTQIEAIRFDLTPAKVLVEGAVLTVSEQIYFATGKSNLDARSAPLLDEVANTLRAHPELVAIEIGGHTDPKGSTSANMKLSQARAGAVVQALVDRGVAPERLVARGYGPTQPQATNDSAEGRAKNRRVEFVSETGE